jgi:hypothetical protein
VVVSATHAHPLETSHPVITDYDGMTTTLDELGLLRLNSSLWADPLSDP